MAAITLNTQLTPLVDVDRAKLNSYLASLDSGDLDNVIAAASDKLRRHLRRNVSCAQYTGYFDGGSYPFDVLFLPDPPVISVDRLATNPQSVITIQNTSTANQRATVAVTSNGLTLVRVASGVTYTDTNTSPISFSANPTIASLVTAISGLGNGWTATATDGYSLFASADLKVTQGAFSAIGGAGASLQIYTENPDFLGGGVFFDGLAAWTVQSGWRLDENKGVIWGSFPPSQLGIRVDWTGGFATIPDVIQEATILTAIAISRAKNINPSLASERLGDASWTLATKMTALPPAARELVSEYVDWAGSRV